MSVPSLSSAARDRAPPGPEVVGCVLVVDDSRVQRRILAVSLRRWGFRVIEAGSAEEALADPAVAEVDLVLSDWVMPGMDGLAFCRAFRALPRATYGYFILLTSKGEKAEIARGLDAGADDFLTKPVAADELRARILAGERILRMEREVGAKNRALAEALGRLQEVYDSLDRDLIEARKLQQTLVRDRHRDFGAGAVSLLLRPSGHVGGDLVGYFPVNARRLAMYAIDVSGHGVASAFMAARLAGLLSTAANNQNIAVAIGAYGQPEAWPPELVAARMNQMMLRDMDVGQYFTMLYAEADLVTGRVSLVQAGHPHPALIRADGRIESVGDGGMPIGLIEGAEYSRVTVDLAPGDRLLMMSDGMTEADGPAGELGDDGLAAMIGRNAALSGPDLLEALMWELAAFHGSDEFRDDVSGVLFSFAGGASVRGGPHAGSG